jgi:hypothetical protein
MTSVRAIPHGTNPMPDAEEPRPSASPTLAVPAISQSPRAPRAHRRGGDLADHSAPGAPPFAALACEFRALASAIEQRPVPVVKAIDPHPHRHLHWLAGGVCLLAIGGLTTALAVRMVAPPEPDAVSPAVRQVLQDDTCAARVTALANAVAAYRAKTGVVPPSLAALYPEFVGFAPVDPASQEPYGYEIVGDLVSIRCPATRPAAASPENPWPDGAGAAASRN